MRYQLILSFILVFAISFSSQSQTTYYIDQVAGNDANAGTIIGAPWKNLSKIYNLTLTPGSKILLKAGSVWGGQQVKFKGSGSSTLPIIVTKYGTGSNPIINGNGLTGQGVVYLYNQQYVEISNLEITNAPNGAINSDFFVGINNGSTNNNPLGADRRGVMVAIDNFGTANHIYLKNLNIHHIKGQLGNGTSTVNGAIPKRTGGIYFTVLGATETTSAKSRFNDILIDSCNVNYCENIGLAFDNEWNVYYPGGNEYTDWYNRRFSNIKVSNNIIHHIGKNAMIIRCTDSTGLIEKNVCYETALGTTGNTIFTARAKGTVLQYNEGYYNRATTQNVDPGNIDGSLYDPDFGSVGIIFQYSYSHDNSQGLYWGCNTRGANNNTTGIPDPGDTACTLRYCISQNDLGDLVYFNYSSAGNEIYNNVFYTKSGLSPNIIHENGGNSHKYNFYNNIIYNLSSASSGADYAFGSGSGVQTRNFSNNTFYGNHPSSEPSDPFKLISNPNFVSPGTATIGIGTATGYKLNYGSPSVASGKIISNNGGLDYYENAVPVSVAPNRGCYQGPGIGAPSLSPVITSFTPGTATAGTTITITGSYFLGATSITIGGVAVTAFTVINDNTITAVVGNGATGYITVVTAQGSGTSSTVFNFCTPPSSPNANSVTICKGSSATLTASGSGTLSWYAAAAGGNRLGVGASYTTPVLFSPTTYYVQDSTCAVSNTRKAVQVNLYASTSSSSEVSACDSYTWPSSGNTYTSSGTYYHSYSNGNNCSSSDTLYLTITTPVVPQFNQIPPVCINNSLSFPGTSLNGISGTWSPAPNNQQTTIYAFTPNSGQCALPTTMTVTVVASPIVPTFNQANSICKDHPLTLPVTSTEGVVGSWTPAPNNQSTTTYTFTPEAGECAVPTTLTIAVKTNSPVRDTVVEALNGFLWQGVNYTTSGTYTWTGTNSAGCDSLIRLHLTVISCIAVYPNPTADVININLLALDNTLTNNDVLAKNVRVVVFDPNGKKIYSKQLNQLVTNGSEISLRKCSRGIYFVSIQSSDNSISYRTKILKL